jgi:hypothetical protein
MSMPRFNVGALFGNKDQRIDKREARVAWKAEKPGIGLRKEALLGVKAEKLQRREDRRDARSGGVGGLSDEANARYAVSVEAAFETYDRLVAARDSGKASAAAAKAAGAHANALWDSWHAKDPEACQRWEKSYAARQDASQGFESFGPIVIGHVDDLD